MSTELNLYLIFVLITLLIMVPAFISMFRRNWVQALVKCVFFILSLTVAFILTLTITPTIENGIVVSVNNTDNETIREITQYLQSDADAAKTLLKVIAALASPLLFWLYFLLSMLLFQIVYLILNNIFFKKIQIEAKAPRIISRVATATLFFIRGYAFLCVLLMPFSYYVSLTNDCLANETVAQSMKDSNTITDSTISDMKSLENNVFNQIYAFPNSWYLPTITTIDVDDNKTTVEEIVPQTLKIVTSITSLSGKDVSEIDVSVLVETANQVEAAPIIDSFAGSFLSDAGSKWKQGETFLSIPPLTLSGDNDALNNTLYDILINNKKASTELKAVAALLATYNCINGKNPEAAKQLGDAMQNLDDNSLQILKDATSGDVLSSLSGSLSEEQAQQLSNIISALFGELYALAPKADATQAEIDKFNAEIAKVNDLLSTLGSTDLSSEEVTGRIINDIATSDVILNAVADNISEDTTDDLLNSFGAVVPEGTSQLIYNVIEDMKGTDSELRGEEADYVTDAVVELSSVNPDTGKTLKDICLSTIVTASSVNMLSDPTKKENFFSSLYLTGYPLAQDIVSDTLISLNTSNLDPTKTDEEKEAIRQNTSEALSSVVDAIKAGTTDKETLLGLASGCDIVIEAINNNL